MEWIDVRDRLPNHNEVVLISTDETNVHGPDGRLMREHVATFIKGKTAYEVETSGSHGFADQSGNNLTPYGWKGAGPFTWFGQSVTHWLPIVPVAKRKE